MRAKFILTDKKANKTLLKTRHIEKVYNKVRDMGMGKHIPAILPVLNAGQGKESSILLSNHVAYLQLTRICED